MIYLTDHNVLTTIGVLEKIEVYVTLTKVNFVTSGYNEDYFFKICINLVRFPSGSPFA